MFEFLKKDDGRVINVNEIDDLIGKVELIDIREEYEYKDGSIKSAKNIPMGELLDEPEKYLNKSKEYYIMCQSGGRSARACSNLRNQGFKVINVAGGMGSYIGNKRK
ncbi:rhodanese-like domain-containing protein [Clostridium beijerinckii]|uniref:Rhodanese-like domain-containing protein n=1 Tax=Clostridium beijerinckii TaxID=1520 RepID=A0A1S8S403_CLOBE|nr:rhodanese-like domain-containing protein [Clostridium beijerinckii]MBA8937049.1 rhodanese-related sulfurtransferase [Clostridium beijerinckii]NMF07410.1 rhodanese-like domain-containing protein [Clostridium beijerinckii]NRU40485.1 rhodanese-related sulfurtransferase [Clostridium beijerinckii]NRY62421.1 rhodanese-related sulfurtransferase [Clostridium beijerinckii]NSA96239.1 rhodanese-related sulfurtransferase [Clostridium beijerinckii]